MTFVEPERTSLRAESVETQLDTSELAIPRAPSRATLLDVPEVPVDWWHETLAEELRRDRE